ncbi:LysR family transcriptional regulator [Chondromyces apiculatus]|uniref:Transcriptional regulator, LysR family n=1 Tax=Chondromyces apiculatus DSM 436 TaxID=1192034 RepID=A0A017TAA7_9BACT|nr:LysR family transcriptional regulator [Chondromyces apiculatus]EYF05765.1 Transcriptional regulator, LysR family [Chondromyces apiculatus DSM 436]
MNLSAIDANLVVALDALLRERSVTRAAQRMGLSQPAMSHTLTRLRGALGDPLLVRVGRQMTLTERAEGITARVAALVQELKAIFDERPPAFEPGESTRAFRLAASDEVQVLLLPALQKLCAREAPQITLHAVPLGEVRIVEALRSGEVDLALGAFASGALASDVRRTELQGDRLVGLTRVQHPRIRMRADMETYLAMRHLRVAHPGGQDPVDELLGRRGLTRHVAMTVPHFLVAPHVVADSDLIVALPKRIAEAFAPGMAVRTFEMPFDLSTPEIVMAWHDRVHADPAHGWLRRLAAQAAARASQGGRRRRRG